MLENSAPFKIVDAQKLSEKYRSILHPGEKVTIENTSSTSRASVELPRYFYEIPDWNHALEWQITEHFALYEFLVEDLHEAQPFQEWPRYVPIAITQLAAALELFRAKVGKLVFIAANGGYRTPEHSANRACGSIHSWGTAANIYRIGDEYLDSKDTIERYAELAKKSSGGIWTRSYGHGIGEADDHLHIDIGFTVCTPRSNAAGT